MVTVAGVAAFMGIAVATPPVVLQLQHPRNEAAFQVGVLRYGVASASLGRTRDARAWATADPAEVLAAGDRACEWLRNQADPPSRALPAGEFTSAALRQRYVAGGGRVASGGADSRDVRIYTVASAWRNLCWLDSRAKTAPVQGSGEGD